MALTQERVEALSAVLTADAERAKYLLSLEPGEALTQINALGNDFTLEEIKEFGATLNAVAAHQGELDAKDLDEVAGGMNIATGIFVIDSLLSIFNTGVSHGKAIVQAGW